MKHDIAIVATEMRPYCRVGDLGVYVDSLARELVRRGHAVTVFLPRYSVLSGADELRSERSVAMAIPMGEESVQATADLTEVPESGIRIVWIGNAHYFHRPDPYVDPKTGLEWGDSAARWIFFNKSVVAALDALALEPDLVHLNDHQAALVPLLLREGPDTPPRLRDLGCLFSIHQIGLQGVYDRSVLPLIGLPPSLAAPLGPLEYFGRVNFMKSALISADLITTVSPTHAEQIQQSREVGAGLEGILAMRRNDLVGILHGIDTDSWNPATDDHLPYQFTRQNLQGKRSDKIRFLESMELPVEPNVPLIAMVAPLREDQGFGLLQAIASDLLGERVKLAVLGAGETYWEKELAQLRKVFPHKFAWSREPGVPLERLAFAGSDLMLIAPHREACGQVQMRAMRYGTVPIAHATGGLIDTVRPFSSEIGKGEGFLFREYTGGALLDAMTRALAAYGKRSSWKKLVQHVMSLDHSWAKAALAFEPVYSRLLGTPDDGQTS